MARIKGGSKAFGYLFTSQDGERFTLTSNKKISGRSKRAWNLAGWKYKKIWGK